MNRIDVTVPKGKGANVARMALDVGISEASVQQVYVHGPNKDKEVVGVQVATPDAARFVDALMSQSYYNPKDYSIVSDEIPAVVSSESPIQVTRPFHRTTMDVFEGLWMRVHITPSYLARASVSALLLAYGMIQNDLITMVAALLFTPFLEPALATSFGLMTQEWRLAQQGAERLCRRCPIRHLSGLVWHHAGPGTARRLAGDPATAHLRRQCHHGSGGRGRDLCRHEIPA